MNKKYIIQDCTDFEKVFKELFDTKNMPKRINSYIEYNDSLKQEDATLESLKEKFDVEEVFKNKGNREKLSNKEKETIKYWHNKILAVNKVSDKFYY